MSGSAYTNPEQLKKTLTMQGTTFADYDIEPAIFAASDAINELCGRKFDRDITVDATRYYRPVSTTVIVVDDLISVTSLTCDQDGDGAWERTYTAGSDYNLWPYNAVADDRPFTQIHLNAFRSTVGFPFWADRSVKLVGKFGWPVQPSFLEVAAKMLASKLIKRMREAPFGIVTVGLDVGSAMRIGREDPDVCSLIQNFVREKVV